jgi:hypothetical protein
LLIIDLFGAVRARVPQSAKKRLVIYALRGSSDHGFS